MNACQGYRQGLKSNAFQSFFEKQAKHRQRHMKAMAIKNQPVGQRIAAKPAQTPANKRYSQTTAIIAPD